MWKHIFLKTLDVVDTLLYGFQKESFGECKKISSVKTQCTIQTGGRAVVPKSQTVQMARAGGSVSAASISVLQD